MLVVIDANELFSLLIQGSRASREIFLSDRIELIAPEFLMEEFANNMDEILSKTHRTEAEFLEFMGVLRNRITLVPESTFCLQKDEACNLLPRHQKDSAYLALAIKYECPVWSEEKLLREQPKVRVFNTKELFEMVVDR